MRKRDKNIVMKECEEPKDHFIAEIYFMQSLKEYCTFLTYTISWQFFSWFLLTGHRSSMLENKTNITKLSSMGIQSNGRNTDFKSAANHNPEALYFLEMRTQPLSQAERETPLVFCRWSLKENFRQPYL